MGQMHALFLQEPGVLNILLLISTSVIGLGNLWQYSHER